MEVEYQDDDITVISRNPLRGTLTLVTYDEDGDPSDIDLTLDKDAAEALVSALMQFLMAGEGEDMPNLQIGRKSK
ncbi:hypothetical protein HB777_15255 [Mesorhizobium loti]|nr:hypothetical protein HB777_15255 [Mesorhizobium loti]